MSSTVYTFASDDASRHNIYFTSYLWSFNKIKIKGGQRKWRKEKEEERIKKSERREKSFVLHQIAPRY
jgi:hypothetical protein